MFSHNCVFLSLSFSPALPLPPNQDGTDFWVLSFYSVLGTFIKVSYVLFKTLLQGITPW